MKFLSKTKKDSDGVILSVSFKFSPIEVLGARETTDRPQYIDIKNLEAEKNPQVLLSHLRELIYNVEIFNEGFGKKLDETITKKISRRKRRPRKK